MLCLIHLIKAKRILKLIQLSGTFHSLRRHLTSPLDGSLNTGEVQLESRV